MNLRTYERWYPYGAYAFESTYSQESTFHQTRYQNFQSFLDSNPALVPKGYRGTAQVRCQMEFIAKGTYRCGTPRRSHSCRVLDLNDDGGKYFWDHKHAMRVKGRRGAFLVASHPYADASAVASQDIPSFLIKGVRTMIFDTSKSWYAPGRTALILTATPETFKFLNIECLGSPVAQVDGALQGE